MNTPCVASWPDLSPHDKATLAIDAIDNELPDRSTLPFEFLELAVIALQKSTDDARAAVRQHNKTIDELCALCNSLEERLRALSLPPPAAPPIASSPGSVAVHPAESLHKPPEVSAPQSPARAATSALPYSPTSPIALSALPSDASIDIAPPSSVPTPTVAPLAAPPGAAVGSTPAPHFRGQRSTKPNELHVQFKSRAEFNTKLMRFFDNNIISHQHALLDALVGAISTRIDENSAPLFSGNRLCAAFWTPRGNLLIWFLKAPSLPLLTFMLNILEMVCGAKDFVVLNRPAISAFKLSSVPTRTQDGTPVDLNQLLLALLEHPQLCNAALWHMPRFISFKGAPIGRCATLFFSVTDSPSYNFGRAIIGSTVNINGCQFIIEKWHYAKLKRSHLMPIGKHSMFKENTGLLSPSKSHHNMPRERFLALNEFCHNHVSPPPLACGNIFDY
ncbi:hypothetical protein AX14_006149 [Amanita brunnescens Koide BX004]|nr:hypothetical protein AX14_006149 [Amanita brunnescens Koide BX004]